MTSSNRSIWGLSAIYGLACFSCGDGGGNAAPETASGGAPETGTGGMIGSSGGADSLSGGSSSTGGSAGSGAGSGANSGSGGSDGSGGADPEVLPRSQNFGTVRLHAEKLGLYMVPDLPPQYFEWEKTERSLARVHELFPDAWIRWDNETGHVTDTPENVTRFVEAAGKSDIQMIVTASAVDGYKNWWANGLAQPTTSIRQIADGPYLVFAKKLLDEQTNVRLIETINEPDTIWFVADPDNLENWQYYMSKLYAATGNDYEHILGPSAAFVGSNLWNDIAGRPELPLFSYHTYSGHEGLREVGEKKVYVTEYGFDLPEALRDSPAQIMADLYEVERLGKLESRIEKIFYVDLQMMMRAADTEGDHFGFSGMLRTLMAYHQLSRFSQKAYLDAAMPRFLATDNEAGGFATLAWNHDQNSTLSGVTFTVPGTSVDAQTEFWVLRIENKKTGAATCNELDAQSALALTVSEGIVNVTLSDLPPLAAVLVSTESCEALAN